MPYEPREDSFLIQKHIKEFFNKHSNNPGFSVLDMGTGSGILAEEAAKYSKNVLAVDIDLKVIRELKANALRAESNPFAQKAKQNSHTNIKFLQSDLFSKIPKTKKFDLILFNPPYIPTKTLRNREKIKFIDLDGGKNGTEVIEAFLKDAKLYLKPTGKILLLTSSLNKHITTLFDKYNYKYKLIDKEKFAFEELYVWLLK